MFVIQSCIFQMLGKSFGMFPICNSYLCVSFRGKVVNTWREGNLTRFIWAIYRSLLARLKPVHRWAHHCGRANNARSAAAPMAAIRWPLVGVRSLSSSSMIFFPLFPSTLFGAYQSLSVRCGLDGYSIVEVHQVWLVSGNSEHYWFPKHTMVRY
jgi:hypothetical protein